MGDQWIETVVLGDQLDPRVWKTGVNSLRTTFPHLLKGLTLRSGLGPEDGLPSVSRSTDHGPSVRVDVRKWRFPPFFTFVGRVLGPSGKDPKNRENLAGQTLNPSLEHEVPGISIYSLSIK